MTAVYWGQLVNCESPPFKIHSFQCGNKSAYRALCCFAVFLFLLQLSLLALLIYYKDQLIVERATLNDYSRLSVEEVDVPDRDNVNAPMNWKAAPFRLHDGKDHHGGHDHTSAVSHSKRHGGDDHTISMSVSQRGLSTPERERRNRPSEDL